MNTYKTYYMLSFNSGERILSGAYINVANTNMTRKVLVLSPKFMPTTDLKD